MEQAVDTIMECTGRCPKVVKSGVDDEGQSYFIIACQQLIKPTTFNKVKNCVASEVNATVEKITPFYLKIVYVNE